MAHSKPPTLTGAPPNTGRAVFNFAHYLKAGLTVAARFPCSGCSVCWFLAALRRFDSCPWVHTRNDPPPPRPLRARKANMSELEEAWEAVKREALNALYNEGGAATEAQVALVEAAVNDYLDREARYK